MLPTCIRTSAGPQSMVGFSCSGNRLTRYRSRVEHSYAVAVVEYIENFWGFDLSESLARDISLAPDTILAEFLEGWPNQVRAGDPANEPTVIGRGEVRPVLAASWDLARERRVALTMLLYVPSILISADLLHFGWYLDTENFSPSDGRERMRRNVVWLSQVRPLIFDGSIHFGGGNLGYQDWTWREGVIDCLLGASRKAWRGTRLEDAGQGERRNELLNLSQTLIRALGEVAEGRGTAIGLSSLEDAAYRVLLESGHTEQGRSARLARIAEGAVPALKVEATNVVRLRGADSFAEWRSALAGAVREASEVSEQEDGIPRAREIVAAELGASFEGVRKEVEGSPGLSKLHIGWRGIGLGALTGAGGALTTGAPLAAAAAALATGATAAGAVMEGYLTQIEKRARNRALWDIVMSFKELSSS